LGPILPSHPSQNKKWKIWTGKQRPADNKWAPGILKGCKKGRKDGQQENHFGTSISGPLWLSCHLLCRLFPRGPILLVPGLTIKHLVLGAARQRGRKQDYNNGFMVREKIAKREPIPDLIFFIFGLLIFSVCVCFSFFIVPIVLCTAVDETRSTKSGLENDGPFFCMPNDRGYLGWAPWLRG